MKKVDEIIVFRAILTTGSTVMLLYFFVREPHLTIAIMEFGFLLVAILSAHSWGKRHGRSEVLDFLETLGHQNLAAEYLRRHESDDDEDSAPLSEEESRKIPAVTSEIDIDSGKSSKGKENSAREKLTEEQRKRIPEEAKERTHQELADQYGVSRQYISRLCKEVDESKSSTVRNFWRT